MRIISPTSKGSMTILQVLFGLENIVILTHVQSTGGNKFFLKTR